jgi:hypothetical protein
MRSYWAYRAEENQENNYFLDYKILVVFLNKEFFTSCRNTAILQYCNTAIRSGNILPVSLQANLPYKKNKHFTFTCYMITHLFCILGHFVLKPLFKMLDKFLMYYVHTHTHTHTHIYICMYVI